MVHMQPHGEIYTFVIYTLLQYTVTVQSKLHYNIVSTSVIVTALTTVITIINIGLAFGTNSGTYILLNVVTVQLTKVLKFY